jgi:hypothetical protein
MDRDFWERCVHQGLNEQIVAHRAPRRHGGMHVYRLS